MADLKKSMGFPALIAMGAGGVIGSSWVYTNGLFFDKYGAGGVIVGMILGIIIATCVALAYAELAAQLPRAGGEVVYGYLAFNRVVGFIAGWVLIGSFVSSLAFYMAVIGQLLSKIFPILSTIPIYSIAESTVYLPELLIGLGLIVLVCLINIWGLSLGARIQLLLFFTMVIIGLALAIGGFSHGQASNFFPAYHSKSGKILPTIRFVLPAMTYLTGFSLVAILAEDSKLPPRKIGIVVISTILFAGVFYVFVLLGSAWVIPWEQTSTLKQGMIDSYHVAGLSILSWGAYAAGILGLLTSLMALFTATSRIMLALARAGLFPRFIMYTSKKRGTPVNALLFTLALTVVLGWLGRSSLLWFLDDGGVFIGLAWLIGVLSMYRIRRRYPQVKKDYKVQISWIPIIGGIGAALIIIYTLIPNTSMSLVWPYEYIILVAWFLLGFFIYIFGLREHDDTSALKELLGKQYEKYFGGSEVNRIQQVQQTE